MQTIREAKRMSLSNCSHFSGTKRQKTKDDNRAKAQCRALRNEQPQVNIFMPTIEVKIDEEETITIPRIDYLIRNDAWVLACWLINLNVAAWMVYSPFVILGQEETYHKAIQIIIATGSILIALSTFMIFITIKFTRFATSLPTLYMAVLLVGPIGILVNVLTRDLVQEHPAIFWNIIGCDSVITIASLVIFFRFRGYISRNFAGGYTIKKKEETTPSANEAS